jgi:hypothetical protein
MPISEEQRKILLERLEKARQAKEIKKQEAKSSAEKEAPLKKAHQKKQERSAAAAAAAAAAPAPAPTPVIPSSVVTDSKGNDIPFDAKGHNGPPAPEPVTKVLDIAGNEVSLPTLIKQEKQEKQEKREKVEKDDDLSQKQKSQKKAYAKVVFYEKPSKRETERMMRTIHDESSSEEEVDDEPTEQELVKKIVEKYGYKLPETPQQQRQQQQKQVPPSLRGHPAFRPSPSPSQQAQRLEYLKELSRQYFY